MENDKAVSVLNNLIETCKDGEEGFKVAAEGLNSPDVKAKFLQHSRERAQMSSELQAEVTRLGGSPERSGSVSGSLHRGWMDIKSAVTGKNDDAIVAEAERGEDVAKKVFDDALNEPLPPSARNVVERHAANVRRTHDEVRNIRDHKLTE